MTREEKDHFMAAALAEARKAFESGEVPVGACVVKDGEILSTGRNRREETHDPLAHAEIEALRAAAARLGGWNLSGCTLFVTLEPCPMCTGALLQARVSRVIFGAFDGAAGCCGTLYDLPEDPRLMTRAEVEGGILREECAALLKDFFRSRRESRPVY